MRISFLCHIPELPVLMSRASSRIRTRGTSPRGLAKEAMGERGTRRRDQAEISVATESAQTIWGVMLEEPQLTGKEAREIPPRREVGKLPFQDMEVHQIRPREIGT